MKDGYAFKVVPKTEQGSPELIVSWLQYRHMVKIGMIEKKDAMEYLPEAEVDALIGSTGPVDPLVPAQVVARTSHLKVVK